MAMNELASKMRPLAKERGRFRSRRRLERQPDRRGSGNQRFHGLPSAQATGGGRPRSGFEPQGAGPAFRAANFRRREASAADRSGLLQTARGARALEPASSFGEQGGRAWHCRGRQRLDDSARAQKNALKPYHQSGTISVRLETVLASHRTSSDARPSTPHGSSRLSLAGGHNCLSSTKQQITL